MSAGIFILILIVLALLIFVSQSPQKSVTEKKKAKKKISKKVLSPEEKRYKHYLSQFTNTPKNARKLAPEYTKVAGVRYQNDDTGEERQEIISRSFEGEKVMLVPDELNPFDPDAVKVVRLNGEQIGFLNTDLAMEIKSRLMRRLFVEASIKQIQEEKGIRQVILELTKYSRKEK